MNLLTRDTLFDLDSFFNQYNTPTSNVRRKSDFLSPQVDIKDNGNGYSLIAELPGIPKEDIHVTVDDSILTIEANTVKESTTEENGKVLRRERRSGKYLRTFNIGSDVDIESIKAEFKDGLLILNLPKTQEENDAPKRIEIH